MLTILSRVGWEEKGRTQSLSKILNNFAMFLLFSLNLQFFRWRICSLHAMRGGVGGGHSAKRKCAETECLLKQNWIIFGHFHFWRVFLLFDRKTGSRTGEGRLEEAGSGGNSICLLRLGIFLLFSVQFLVFSLKHCSFCKFFYPKLGFGWRFNSM
mgnify:CR=1 FL=1